MANYFGVTRTNYFHVNDQNAFREFMGQVQVAEDSVDVWEDKDSNGKTVFAFGCYSYIMGVADHVEAEEEDEDCDYDYDKFINGLMKLVADDDAIIITEIGNEKLRYLVGEAVVITSRGWDFCDVQAIAMNHARDILSNKQWDTKLSY